MHRRPPYGEIADLLRNGRVIPFLGAGVNAGSRPQGEDWTEQTTEFLPRGDELSLFLADKINFPSVDRHDLTDLAKVSSYFAEVSSRSRLLERISEIFKRKEYDPCDVHMYLASLAKSAELAKKTVPSMTDQYKPLLIITTNYDDLTELAFKKMDCPYDLVVHPTDRKDRAGSVLLRKYGQTEPEWVRPNNLFVDLDTTTVIYKMHGTVDRGSNNLDSYVITEEDYIDFLSLMTSQQAVPNIFMSHFYSRQFLFLGYGLRDWNFRVMLKNLKDVKQQTITPADADDSGPGETSKQIERGKSWAIQYNPEPLEMELWDARQVIIYNEGINKFVAELRKRTQFLPSLEVPSCL